MSNEARNNVKQPSTDRRPPARRASCVLVAEDDEEMRALLARSLRQTGYSVIECADGLDLMEHLASLLKEDKRQHIDLVVSDIRMPWVTGLEVLRCTDDYLGYPPFVLISAFADDETRAQARALGAAVMLSKPFEMEYFVEVIRTIVQPESPWI